MGTAARVAGLVVFALFVSVLVSRPFLATPGVAGLVRDGLAGQQLLVVLPAVLVALLVVAFRLRSLTDDAQEEHVSAAGERTGFQGARGPGHRTGGRQEREDRPGAGATGTRWDVEPGQEGWSEQPAVGHEQGESPEPALDIEEEPPDAMLSDHLDHLEAQLDDDETVREELRTLAAVAEETDRRIPARCPREHCDAVWTGRTVLGIGAGQYERLDDGTRVQCLACEEIHTLE